MLKRKLWRDIRGNIGAYLACVSVLVIGLMIYVSLALTLESLTERKDSYYKDYDFADGFAEIIRAPKGLAEDIKEIDGIKEASGRIAQDAMVKKPSGSDITTVRLISFNNIDQPVNRFKIEEGRCPREDAREVLVSPAFLKANGYKIGGKIPLIIKGREVDFEITGTAKSPEFIYEIPSGKTLTPDPTAFGFAFIPYGTISPMLGFEGHINEIVFTVNKNVSYSDVEKNVSRFLEPYSLLSLYPQKDQLSNSMLIQEIKGLESSVNTTPVIFLIVAGGILYIMLKRMVTQQRGQIGILKAFGFKDWEIMIHYLGYAAVIGITGGFGGGLAGTWLSFYLARLYQTYYNIPGLTGKVSPEYLIYSIVLSLVFCLFAGYHGCKGVLNLSPAEAMKAPAAEVGKKIVLERLKFIWDSLSVQGKMAVRNIFRSRQRSLLTVLGVAAAFSMMVASGASFDAIYHLIDFQYRQVERYDIKINLVNYTDKTRVLNSVRNIEGVTKAETLLEVPVTITNKWLQKDIVITGLEKEGDLYQLLTRKGKPVEVPDNGLVLSEQLAETLDVSVGDIVNIKPLVGERDNQSVVVKAIIPQYVGLGAYMDVDALSVILRSSSVASSILIKADQGNTSYIRTNIQEGKNVSTLHDKAKLKAQFEQLMESSKSQQLIILFFSFVMGFAIVYNVNLIALSERERELATLMVIGMTGKEVTRLLTIEQGIISLAAVVIGVPLSYGMLWAIINASGSEIFNLPLVVKSGSFIKAFLGTALFLAAVQLKIRGKIDSIPLLDVLKQQD